MGVRVFIGSLSKRVRKRKKGGLIQCLFYRGKIRHYYVIWTTMLRREMAQGKYQEFHNTWLPRLLRILQEKIWVLNLCSKRIFLREIEHCH